MSDENDGVTDKLKDVADKVDEKLEPGEQENTASSGASDPFDSAQRPDEARTGDSPSGGID